MPSADPLAPGNNAFPVVFRFPMLNLLAASSARGELRDCAGDDRLAALYPLRVRHTMLPLCGRRVRECF